MGMCDKHMRDLEEISGRKGTQISEIEHECPFLEKKGDEKPWIGERIVDQPGEKR